MVAEGLSARSRSAGSTLDRNADNYFADVEQAGFDPGNFVPGIGPSPDKMLQGRLFAYGDAHRYRLGINHTQLPVNAPHATEAHNYGRDGLMAGDGNGGRAKNYEPNSFDGPVETGGPTPPRSRCTARPAPTTWDRRDTDDFTQAGDLYRLQPADAQARLVDNIAGGLGAVSPGPVGTASWSGASPTSGRPTPSSASGSPWGEGATRLRRPHRWPNGLAGPGLAHHASTAGRGRRPSHGEHVHLSAEQVHGRSPTVLPEVSLATVYNTLNELVAMGEISEIRLSDGTDPLRPQGGPRPPPPGV